MFPIYGVLLLIVLLLWYRTILKLFGFFEKGVLFTAETVRCIQFLGGIYIARFFLALAFKFLLPNDEWVGAGLRDNLFIGFFMIFIGWLLDEARKIREEQELTV
jgi:type IV secretory pathway TrbL component